MDFILILVIATGVGMFFLRKELQRRGKRFVRAYHFLTQLDSGSDIHSANQSARGILRTKTDMINQHGIVMAANRHIATYFGGKQLPLISLAISKGFRDQVEAESTMDSKSERRTDDPHWLEDIYLAAGLYHVAFLGAIKREADNLEFSAAALGALDGTIQASGLKPTDVEMMVMGSAFTLKQLKNLDRLDGIDPERIANLTFEAMTSEALEEIRAQAGQTAYIMHMAQKQ